MWKQGVRACAGKQDKEHAKPLEQAARDGARAPEDRRTTPEQRVSQRAGVEERVWPVIRVMASVADDLIAFVRRHEDELLGDLRGSLELLEEKRREAQRLLREAESGAWRAHMLGHWLQNLADDGAMSRQPAPALVPPPAQFSRHLLEESLTRPWHRRRPWSDAVAPPPTSDIEGRRPRVPA